MSEHRFLQTLATVSASSVLVCGSLLLLTSTAPWIRPPIAAEPSPPDAPRLPEISVELEVAAAPPPPASDQADTDFAGSGDAAGAMLTALSPFRRELLEPVALAETAAAEQLSPAEAEELPQAAGETLSPAEQEFAALGSPLAAEASEEVDEAPPTAVEVSNGAFGISSVAEAPAELAPATPAIPERPIVLASADAARDQIADLLNTLQARAVASDTAAAASEEVADMLVRLPPAPPQVAAREKTDAASDDVAAVAVALPPAAETEAEPAASREVALAPQTPPPPLPRRKPEAAAPEVAASPPPVEKSPAPKDAVAAAKPRERPAAKPAPQQTAQSGGLFGFLNPAKPMALAPADEPPPQAARPATARPSSGAYASQVWARLARHKPRAGQRGSASVAFAIGANGSLGAARIARSSGNARIDQLALQTVRNAAPFPPPPSGSASYTIRIDF